MRGYEIVNQLLGAAEVRTVFQFMAEDTMELMADLETRLDEQIGVVHSRHEQGAVAMADGYARSGDRIGVCVVSRGPGIAQTGTALLEARKNGTRLLVIVPTPSTDDEHDPKAFEQEMYLRSTVGEVATVRSADTLVPVFVDALRRVHVGEGPLAVQIPKDVLKGTVEVPDEVSRVSSPADAVAATRAEWLDGREWANAGRSLGRLEPDPERIEEAVDRFLDSDAFQPPVILAGRGAVAADAREAIEDLAERISAVIVTSLRAREYFADHPFGVGFSGNWGDPLSNEFLVEASYVLSVGCSLDNHTLDDGYLLGEDATVVHVDADPGSFDRYNPVDVGIHSDARLGVEALSAAFERAGIDREGELWSDRLRERIASYSPLDEVAFPEKPGVMDPRDVARTLEEVLPDARLVGNDGGMFTLWFLHELSAGPADSIMGCDFATIGLGVPMGIGTAQFLEDRKRTGEEERTAITICGDGGFMMSLQELETAVRHEIPLVVVVGNDSSLGSEYHHLGAQGGPADVARLSTPSLADVATALGAEGHTATSVEELEAVADRLQNPDGPVVVECIIDHEVRHHSY